MIYILILLIFVLTLYFLTKPRIGKFPSRFLRYDYAHRGIHDNNGPNPENSIKAFKEAVRRGFGIELDVQLSKDEKVVVFHDFDLQRSSGNESKILELNFDELSDFDLFNSDEKIPLFEDVLKIISNKVPIIVELKSESFQVSKLCNNVVSILENYSGKYIIESFNPMVLRWFKKNRPDIIRGQLSRNFAGERRGIQYFLVKNLLSNFISRPDFIAYDHNHINFWIRGFRKIYSIPFIAYTIKSKEEYSKAKQFFSAVIFDNKE